MGIKWGESEGSDSEGLINFFNRSNFLINPIIDDFDNGVEFIILGIFLIFSNL